jgi:hypothetical protein
MSELYTHSAGVLILGVHDMDPPSLFSCTSADIVHALNDLPSASLIIGEGEPLTGSIDTVQFTNGNLDELRNQSMAQRKNGNDTADKSDVKMLRCTIYEASTKSTEMKAIFRGYIVSVLELTRAGMLSVRSMRVQCMGIAAILHVAPLAGFRRTSGTALVNAAAGHGEMPTTPGTDTGVIDSYSALSSTSGAEIAGTYERWLTGADILTKIAYIANAIVYMGEIHDASYKYTEHPEPDDNLLHIKDCIFCNYKVHLFTGTDIATRDPAIFAENADKSISQYIASQLLQSLQGTSILMAISGLCADTNMMMNLVPHFVLGGSADDFRMELKPSQAWDLSTKLAIPEKYVISCNSTLNHLEHLGDPQVLIVNYSSGVGDADASLKSGFPSTGCFGVYSTSEDAETWAKDRYNMETNKGKQQDAVQAWMYKTRFYAAPKWLNWAYLSDMHVTAQDIKTLAENPGNDATAKDGDGTARLENLKIASQIADSIAKALYAHLHGASDMAVFELTPDIRFGLNTDVGCLENHIGSVVDIHGYRGMLQAVRYNYNSGKTTVGTYSITLSRIRMQNNDEKSIICPLYEHSWSTAKQDELYGKHNAKLWSDNYDYNRETVRRTVY